MGLVMTHRNAFALLSLLVASDAFAGEAVTADEYGKLLKACKPSCYKAEGKRPGNNKFVPGCGHVDYPYTAFRLAEGGMFKSEKWTDAKMRGVPGGSANPTPDCKFPDTSSGKWSELIDQVKVDFKAIHPQTVRYVVLPESKYEFSTARSGQVNRD